MQCANPGARKLGVIRDALARDAAPENARPIKAVPLKERGGNERWMLEAAALSFCVLIEGRSASLNDAVPFQALQF